MFGVSLLRLDVRYSDVDLPGKGENIYLQRHFSINSLLLFELYNGRKTYHAKLLWLLFRHAFLSECIHYKTVPGGSLRFVKYTNSLYQSSQAKTTPMS